MRDDNSSGIATYNKKILDLYLDYGHKVTAIISNNRKDNEYIRENLTVLPLFDSENEGIDIDYSKYNLIIFGTANNRGVNNVYIKCPKHIPFLMFNHDDATYRKDTFKKIMYYKERNTHIVRASDITRNNVFIEENMSVYPNLSTSVIYSSSRIEKYYDVIPSIENRGNNCIIISRPHGDKGVSNSIRMANVMGFDKIYYFGSKKENAVTNYYKSLSDKLIIMGQKDIKEIIEVAKDCKCLIHLPTYCEVGPLVTIEMASIGIPSICSSDRCGLFNDDIGIDVKYDDYWKLKKYKNIDINKFSKEKVLEGYRKINTFENWKKQQLEILKEEIWHF